MEPVENHFSNTLLAYYFGLECAVDRILRGDCSQSQDASLRCRFVGASLSALADS